MALIRPKKQLGQHFLCDHNIAKKIVSSLSHDADIHRVVEVGPGTGILTRFLLENKALDTWIIEIDDRAVVLLLSEFPAIGNHLIHGDFLKFNPDQYFHGTFAVIGNFPYNISSQILFRILELRDRVPEIVGMLQKEVAVRLSSPPGNKNYGILSVLLQTWYDIEYLFSVPAHVFRPPPQVQSAVIRLKRNKVVNLDCDELLYVKVVKAAFNQRRKTLRNALKCLTFPSLDLSDAVFDRRAETLSVAEFISLTKMFQPA